MFSYSVGFLQLPSPALMLLERGTDVSGVEWKSTTTSPACPAVVNVVVLVDAVLSVLRPFPESFTLLSLCELFSTTIFTRKLPFFREEVSMGLMRKLPVLLLLLMVTGVLPFASPAPTSAQPPAGSC